MKLEIARGLFVVAALSVASIAAAAWHEADPQVVSHSAVDLDHCPLPPQARAADTVSPDHDLLLLMFGLAQGMRAQG